jgi:hypothetical protein
MIRKLVCTMFVLLAGIGFVMADEIRGVITKVDGNKVTIQKTKKVDKKTENDGEPITIEAAKDVKVNKGMGAKGGKVEVGDAIEGGLKNEMFSKIPGKGLNAQVTTSEGNKSITAIVILAGKKKAAE